MKALFNRWQIFFFTPCLALGSALAHPPVSSWSDLKVDSQYVLEQEIVLSGPRGERIVLLSGHDTILKEIQPLDGISVVQYVFTPETCRTPSEESEMELVLPEDGKSGSEVGVQLRADCRLEIFVETKDLNGLSFYRDY